MTNSEFALEVIKVLEVNGWTQGTYYDKGHYCLVGACYKVDGVDFEDAYVSFTEESEAYRTFYNALLDKLGVSPISWNDSRDREYTQVIDFLRTFVEGN